MFWKGTHNIMSFRKSYYRLLTYVMGFLESMKVVFPGRTYISIPMDRLELFWTESNMRARVAWVEKHLAAWDDVESAANFCRDWHHSRPALRHQALEALGEWQKSERVLSGSEEDTIEITVVAASGLPKSNFRTTNSWVKIVFYGPNKFGGAFRLFELKTELSKSTQNPVWNKTFLFKIISDSKMIDFEVYDRVAGMDKYLTRLRLPFTFIPGVEASFANRS